MGPNDESWEDDPLVRALRAPGTPEELRGEQTVLAAFRGTRPAGWSARRVAGRFGIGATSAVTAVVMTAGVAAAYTRTLPEPVQRIAHGVLGPVGVPAPEPVRAEPSAPPAAATPSRTTSEPSASPTTVPGGSPSAPASGPATPRAGSATPGSPVVTADPTIGATAAPTAGPPAGSVVATPGATPGEESDGSSGGSADGAEETEAPPQGPAPASVAAAVSKRQVRFGRTVRVSGVVRAEDGAPLRGRVVRLGIRPVGGDWTRVATARTDRAGRVTFTSPVLKGTTQLRLGTRSGVRSERITVVVLPDLTVDVAEDAGTTRVTVTAAGGRPGDVLTAFRRTDDGLVRIGSYRLGPAGTAVVSLPTPGREVRVVLWLRGTAQHAPARMGVTVGRRAPGNAQTPDTTEKPVPPVVAPR